MLAVLQEFGAGLNKRVWMDRMEMDDTQRLGIGVRWADEDDSHIQPIASDRPLVLGRGPDCDLIFEHATVSRRHLKLFWRDGQVHARHISRSNPTWLNGRLMIGEAALSPGDVLQLAIVAIEIVAIAESANNESDS